MQRIETDEWRCPEPKAARPEGVAHRAMTVTQHGREAP